MVGRLGRLHATRPFPRNYERTRADAEQEKCSGGDLNPHALRHTPLKRTCLPFHHPSKVSESKEKSISIARVACKFLLRLRASQFAVGTIPVALVQPIPRLPP